MVFHNDQPIEMYKAIRVDSNSIRAHYYAMIAALQWLGIKGFRDATVYTDQSLVSDTYNAWMAGWHRRGWKKGGPPIKNLDLVKQLFDLKQKYGIRVEWVRSSSHLGNECARDLARVAIKNHLSTLKPKKKPRPAKIESHLVNRPTVVLRATRSQ